MHFSQANLVDIDIGLFAHFETFFHPGVEDGGGFVVKDSFSSVSIDVQTEGVIGME